ncbi:MAG TPA: serine/threonine-protein kinase [Gemmatimonadaceae bacterium]|nr:serine/threonine-protein kinase [Gemmatimonadaceae bacterium]
MSDLLKDRVIVAIGTQYDIGDEIGRGAMGVVYRGTDLRLRRTVAIKVLPPDLAFRPETRERFLREAEMAAQLSHPNIVPIFSVDEKDGIVYFVMAFVEGETLGERLEREPRPPIDVVRRVLRDVADALDYAHRRGVVHRDIKPDNILLDHHGARPVVTDFGIARAAETQSRLTVTGVAVGTPAYMSPEQAMGDRELDGRSDIYSLGVVGYRMLAGELPFRASSSAAMMLKHLSEQPAPLAGRRADAPPALVAAIEHALAKRPEDRWQEAGALRDAIETGTTASFTGAQAVNPPPLPAPVPAPMGNPQPVPRERKRRRKREDSLETFAARPVDERIRIARRDVFVSSVGLVAFVGVNAATWPMLWWTVFPVFFMGASVVGKIGSLWADGVRLRDIFDRNRPGGPAPPARSAAPLAPSDVLAGPHGPAVRRAAEDRAHIQMIVSNLAKADRELVPDVLPTVDALAERIASLAQMLHRLDHDVPTGTLERLDARIVEVEREGPAAIDQERRLSLLNRQRTTLADLAERRARVARQLESAGLALENLRLDLLKLRSSGVQAAIHDVQSATQEARALSREIGHVLEAAEEVRRI